MFKKGNIIYFEPFIFPDGGNPKNKYFIVLKNESNNLVLATLPTSKDSIPQYIVKKFGCIEYPEINFNCYYFKSGIDIAHNPIENKSFSFPIDTYVYGFRLNEFDIDIFKEQISKNQIKISVRGTLYKNIIDNLVSCLKKSSSVKKKFKNLL